MIMKFLLRQEREYVKKFKITFFFSSDEMS